MKRIRNFIVKSWRPLLFGLLAVALAVLIIAYRLKTLPGGVSNDEANALTASSSWRLILDNPLFLPHKLMLYVLQVGGFRQLYVLRIVSILWALLFILFFFMVLKHWFTTRISLLGTLMFATSSWYLVLARSLTPDVLLSSLVILMAVGGWLRFGRARALPLLLAAVVAALICYIPGMLWFMLVAAVWQRKAISQSLQEVGVVTSILGAFLFLLLIVPLIYSVVKSPAIGQTLIGLPAELPTWRVLSQNLVNIPLAVFLRSPINPTHWVGRLPLFDIFSSTMFLLGLYSFYYRRQLDRAKLLIGLLVLGAILIALGGTVGMAVLLPTLYIIVTAGINLMLQQWLTVFPRNPVARVLGATLLVVAILMSCAYQTQRYYNAWQHSPQTAQTFNHRL